MNEERSTDHYEDEIDLMELMAVLRRRKWLIAGIVALFLVVAGFFSLTGSKTVTTTLVEADFAGIGKHVYPDGSGFDMYDLVAPDLLQKAAGKIADGGRRDSFLAKPRAFVSIDAFIPFEVQAEMAARQKKGETYIYLPNQFYLHFSEPGHGKMMPEEKKGLLNGIVQAFEERFVNDYVEKPLLAVNLPEDLLSRNDYIDVVSILNSRVDNYIGFLQQRIQDAGYYRSPESGRSFVDILKELEQIRDIDLQEIKSVIMMLSMTKQTDMLSRKYQYRIRQLEMARKKKEGEAHIARELLDDVWEDDRVRGSRRASQEGDTSSMIMMDASVMEKLSQKEYISFLVKTALESGVQANALEVDKAVIEEQLSALQQRNKDSDSATVAGDYVEKKLEESKIRLILLGSQANRLNREYLAGRYADVIRTLKQPVSQVVYRVSPLKALVLSLVAGLMLAIFMAFMVEFVANARRKNLPAGE